MHLITGRSDLAYPGLNALGGELSDQFGYRLPRRLSGLEPVRHMVQIDRDAICNINQSFVFGISLAMRTVNRGANRSVADRPVRQGIAPDNNIVFHRIPRNFSKRHYTVVYDVAAKSKVLRASIVAG